MPALRGSGREDDVELAFLPMTPRHLPWAGAAIAFLVFALEIAVSPRVAVGTLYLAAILVAGRFCSTRGVALTAICCACLLLLASYFGSENWINAAIRISAIGIGTFLVVKAQSAEDAARRSEAEWRVVFENSPIMYFMVDAVGVVLSVNAAAAAALGYPADELVGQSVLRVFPDSDRGRVWENLRFCLENLGQSNAWEAQQVCNDGSMLWVRGTARALRRSSGGVVVLIACEDVTERRRAEEAVREGARRFRALIEHAYDTVFLVGRNGALLYATPSVERVLGYASRELVGSNVFDLVHPDEREDVMRRIAAMEDRHGASCTSANLFRHRNGTWLWTENSVTNLLAEPSVRAFVVNLRDIDSRKRAEEGLRDSEQRFRDYAETASDWFWESGPDHRFTSFSHQAPHSAAQIGATRWDLAADFEEEPDKWRAHRAILEAREPFRDFTYNTVRPDGSAVWISVSGKPVFDQQGRFVGYRGVGTDVSDRVRADAAERELQDARMGLAHFARITSLGEMTASIAHEVNQPLAAVIMNAGTAGRWLNAEPPNLEEARRALASIASDGRRASDVIGRIRALAKKDPILKDRVDINEAIRETLALMHGEIVRNRVGLTTRVADPAPLILGDRVQLQQVILNLILNAIEAMGECEPRELSIETGKDDRGNVLVSVSDTGAGLDPTQADRLFQPFYSTKPGGMGMGLSICRSILESHQGRIWARPNGERGCTFEFAIPVATERATIAE